MNTVILPEQNALLDSNLLRRFQLAWESLQSLAALGGTQNYILSGCVQTGTNVTDGVIVINGEVLEFRGGEANTYIIVQNQEVVVESGGGSLTEVNRFVEFGVGEGQISWNSIRNNRFALPYFSKELSYLIAPADNHNLKIIVEDVLPGKSWENIRKIEAYVWYSTGNSSEMKKIEPIFVGGASGMTTGIHFNLTAYTHSTITFRVNLYYR